MNVYKCLIITALGLALGCDPGLPGGGTQVTGYAAPLSQTEFNNLPPDQQYKVANKLLNTMFRGVSAEDFFDLSAGTADLQPKITAAPDSSIGEILPATFLQDTRSSLTTNLLPGQVVDIDEIIEGIDLDGDNEPDPAVTTAKYIFFPNTSPTSSQRPRQIPLARIHEYPVSRDMFVHWMAYVLANTIMFSPAEEMDSPDMGDVQAVYRFLVTNINEGRTIREIIRSHLPSLQRWRVSRSPENHALEAYELYLGLFEGTEEDSLRGGIACQNLYLTDEDANYLIGQTDHVNSIPQLILADENVPGSGFFITTCNDLYDVIAGHPLVIPRAIEVVLNYFMAGRSQEDRLSMIESIAASNPETFDDIFLAILFSREYLLNTERVKSFEENFLSMLHALRWSPDLTPGQTVGRSLFSNMTSNAGSRLYLRGMGWDVMSLKIGRLPDVPVDVLSFSNYHKAIREQFFVTSPGRFNFGGNTSGGEVDGFLHAADGSVRDVVAGLSLEEFIDLLFLNTVHRKASDTEKTDLIDLYQNSAFGSSHLVMEPDGSLSISEFRYRHVAGLTFDYISRLPEFYYFTVVDQEQGP